MELQAASELYKTKHSGDDFEADTLTSYQPKSPLVSIMGLGTSS